MFTLRKASSEMDFGVVAKTEFGINHLLNLEPRDLGCSIPLLFFTFQSKLSIMQVVESNNNLI